MWMYVICICRVWDDKCDIQPTKISCLMLLLVECCVFTSINSWGIWCVGKQTKGSHPSAGTIPHPSIHIDCQASLLLASPIQQSLGLGRITNHKLLILWDLFRTDATIPKMNWRNSHGFSMSMPFVSLSTALVTDLGNAGKSWKPGSGRTFLGSRVKWIE